MFESILIANRGEIGYDSLGTVEFVLADGSETPYFLEMNTRLQVEHPVTELVTGLDLVEWQIRIAGGEPLPLAQAVIAESGWAIEARINCEDPAHGYRPELGTVRRYVEPALAGVRTDSGITTGSEIAPQYDSIVAKLIGHGATRAQSIERLRAGLAAFEAAGIGTNQSLLCAIVDHSLFRSGQLTTGFLAEAFGDGWRDDPAALCHARIAAALHALGSEAGGGTTRETRDSWQRRSGYRLMAAAARRAVSRMRVVLDGDEVALAIERDGDGAGLGVGDGWKVRIGNAAGNAAQLAPEPAIHADAEVDVRAHWLAPDQLLLTPRNGVARRFTFTPAGDLTIVNHLGTRWRLQVLSEVQALARVAEQAATQGSEIRSEMPGAITAINVSPGDVVTAGDVLVVMEAMKLIFPQAAPRAGKVAAVSCALGEIVPRGQTLVQLEPIEPPPAMPTQSPLRK